MERKTLVIKKPWGEFHQFTLNEVSTVKVLIVNPGARLSYQSHERRDEFWLAIEPVGALIDGSFIEMKVGDELFIPRGTKHRLVGLVSTGKVLEISLGEFDEGDIERHEDDYGRVGS